MRCRSGSIGTTFGLLLPCMVGFVALGTDYGSFFLERRRLQVAADMAAMAAAGSPGREEIVARDFVERNGGEGTSIRVVLGGTVDDGGPLPLFRPAEAGGAVSVGLERRADIYFSRLFLSEGPMMRVEAVAVAQPTVSASVGSRLLSVSGGVPAALTQAILGTRVDLSLLSHDGFLKTRVETGRLLSAVASSVGASVGTVGDILDRRLPPAVIFGAVAVALREDGQASYASRVERMSSSIAKGEALVSLRDVLSLPEDIRDVSLTAPSAYLSTRISAAGILAASMARADQGTVVSTSVDVPGLVEVRVEASIGEPMVSRPSIGVGDATVRLSTAQVRSRVSIETGAVLGLLGTKALLPVEIVVAPADVRVVSVTCSADPSRREVVVEARTGAARIEIGSQSHPLRQAGIDQTGGYARIVDTPALRVGARAAVSLRAGSPIRLRFVGAQIGGGMVQTARSTGMVGGLVSDLLGRLELRVEMLGLGLGLGGGPVTSTLAKTLGSLAVPLDGILDGVLQTAGVGLGEVDVRVDDARCGSPRIAR